MPLSLNEKKVVVAEVAEVAKDASSIVAAEYRGLNVAEMTEFRRQARAADVYVRVVPNNLAKRAVESTDFECLREGLKGPLVLAFARDDPGSAARVVRDYRRTNRKLEVRLVAFGGKLVDPADIDTVANLPHLGGSDRPPDGGSQGTRDQVRPYPGRAPRRARPGDGRGSTAEGIGGLSRRQFREPFSNRQRVPADGERKWP